MSQKRTHHITIRQERLIHIALIPDNSLRTNRIALRKINHPAAILRIAIESLDLITQRHTIKPSDKIHNLHDQPQKENKIKLQYYI